MKSLIDINIEKSRSGVYKDNPENRRLHRVGQRYGNPAKEEVEHHQKELDNLEAKKEQYIKQNGQDKYDERKKKIEDALDRAKKEVMRNTESKKPSKVKIDGKTFRVEDGKVVASNRNGFGEIKGVKTMSREMPEPPEPFVYSDNGSMDLEKQGKNGFSVWVGFQHSDRGRQPVNEAKMDRFARTTAVQQFLDAINNKYGTNFQPKDVEVENKWKTTDFFRLFLPVSSTSENSSEPKKFSRVNLPDIPNAHKVNLTKYLSAKRKKAVDDAWNAAKFDSLTRDKAGVFQEGYNKLREQFNNNFDGMSKSERAELLYKILKMKNAMERK